ncbi:L,D-transpeptidase family protein [Lichenihabitans sp. Uapishka_5]|uniref:L,D-transpeptidase family protein n=1 Tax=Lichenihabitans sp. Uapishka_5 TaxID=3037302 RepID=UPI0029E7D02E|nr:L,D-transpeptidase family protein [Lichenihabitans sp. Uapishka_5]MDX7952789.1 L,D-transpeptidase family protein [Lichenihabitans sp. Uapishka_5]
MIHRRFTQAGLLASAALCGLCTAAIAPAFAQDQPSSGLLSPAPIAGIPTPTVPAVPVVTLSKPVVPAPAAVTAVAPAQPVVGAQPTVPTAPAIPGAAATVAAPASPAAPIPTAQLKPVKKVAPPAPPRETALSTDPNPSLTPETFFATAKASEHYATIADAGGWPVVPAALTPGSSGKAVTTLRLRLAIEGYLRKGGMFETTWTPDLTEAVKSFQIRHGLKDSGLVQGATLKALNVPANVRFTELASSAQRLAGRPFNFAQRYVVVNIPSASVETVESGVVHKRYVAVVGDPDHPSPEVDTKVVAVNLNPTWTLPVSIIKNEIIPKMQKDPGYLAKQKIRILDGAGHEVNARSINWTTQHATNYILRQDSGTANALGSIRINMPNKDAVYMHDTPSKRFFGADFRFLSHGCVRVQGVYDLAAWLLNGTPGAPDGQWSKEVVEGRIDGGEHQEVRLTTAVPVSWVYMTGWSNGEGPANFRDDVYGIDTIGAPAEARADLQALSR